jgi:hypothetical protein
VVVVVVVVVIVVVVVVVVVVIVIVVVVVVVTVATATVVIALVMSHTSSQDHKSNCFPPLPVQGPSCYKHSPVFRIVNTILAI